MDYLYEQIKHYKGVSTRPLHGVFPHKQKSESTTKKEIKSLAIDPEFEEKLINTLQNLALHGRNRYEIIVNGGQEPYEDRREARDLIHEELRGLFRHLRGEQHFLRRAPRPQRALRLPPRNRGVQLRGIVHKELITNLFESLGVNYTDDESIIFKKNHYFRVNLKTSEVYIHFADDEKKYASICLQPISTGWSNTDLTNFELGLISKVTAIIFDDLPQSVKYQIGNFLKNEVGGPNLMLRYGTRQQYEHGIGGLRDEMLRELARLRDIMRGGDGHNDGQEYTPRPPVQRRPYVSTRASLQNELRDLFRHMRNDA